MNQLVEEVISAEPLVPSKKDDGTLVLVHDIIHTFNKLKIRYCHWKSNEHLRASMLGITDLDILFDEPIKQDVEMALRSCGFKKFISVKEKQYRDIEDYIGLDARSGKIIHLHAHFKLTLGESYLKGYQLNLESRIVDTRVFDTEFNLFRSSPAYELILLFFRHALKVRNRDILKKHLKKSFTYRENILNEYRWLKLRCTNEEVKTVLMELFPNYAPIYNLVIQEFTYDTTIRLSRVLKSELRHQRLHSPVRATLLRWYREIAVKLFVRLSKFSTNPVVSHRVHPRRGIIIALIGADGSGKSTVIENLQLTFKKKIDVFNLYMGKGKSGRIPWQRKLLIRFKKNYTEHKPQEKNNVTYDLPGKKKKSFKLNLFKCVEALIVASERKRKLKLMQVAKAKGMLVICDRFPQNQLMGYNDGPALNYLLNSKNILFRLCARREAKIYSLTQTNQPDMLFKLVADPGVIASRKPSKASSQMLELKIQGVINLKFREGCKVVNIDANRPVDEVLANIKEHIWSAWV